ncbi:hypothetical protein MCUN1_003731 [Malassezia cuniculi]|uniref:Uncharacterized protein n=1 Tax=Malassezia cuniculi TaxID=948313 RepID=A0AAF0JDE1_9BASI|nr:hypothetical protein MCUN1_003731 [Malassezia cuniculi]
MKSSLVLLFSLILTFAVFANAYSTSPGHARMLLSRRGGNEQSSSSKCDKHPELNDLKDKLRDALPQFGNAMKTKGGSHRGNATEAYNRVKELMSTFDKICN